VGGSITNVVMNEVEKVSLKPLFPPPTAFNVDSTKTRKNSGSAMPSESVIVNVKEPACREVT
jgi:hypothetical protein